MPGNSFNRMEICTVRYLEQGCFLIWFSPLILLDNMNLLYAAVGFLFFFFNSSCNHSDYTMCQAMPELPFIFSVNNSVLTCTRFNSFHFRPPWLSALSSLYLLCSVRQTSQTYSVQPGWVKLGFRSTKDPHAWQTKLAFSWPLPSAAILSFKSDLRKRSLTWCRGHDTYCNCINTGFCQATE